LILVVAAGWFFISSSRAGDELAQRQAALAEQQRRTREREQQIAAERKRAESLFAQLHRGTNPQQFPPQKVSTPTPTPTVPGPIFASLTLTVGGVRSIDRSKTPTLVIPVGTTQVRLQLNLADHAYTGYRVSLRAVGGGEIFTRADLKPRLTKSGASFVLTVPAVKFATGDYILTLSAVSQDGELEDLSKSIFRVEKKVTLLAGHCWLSKNPPIHRSNSIS